MTGVVFGLAFGHELVELLDPGRQVQILHVSFGLMGVEDELFEFGGAVPPQAVKLRLVGHGTGCPPCVAAYAVKEIAYSSP